LQEQSDRHALKLEAALREAAQYAEQAQQHERDSNIKMRGDMLLRHTQEMNAKVAEMQRGWDEEVARLKAEITRLSAMNGITETNLKSAYEAEKVV
jgi:hypothetical protein